ncbi:coproporphyrinogen III oxidase [Clostridium cellulovorans]|uniref:Coproporphyrinogen dehydrogenase n=1 Tax=Clostridium cellulovorans (strain ATCC 35296 / DSM 3052 / OCM 3 / 743B) TaxID=573061 RepID=D9SMU5_CLOC7|nr:coproporphyrinogen III oxidase [Clostridium cellulovorans]ADL51811.1 Coproporphyrinogen dehydrogenase [Clostridium cellulovorans 743B]
MIKVKIAESKYTLEITHIIKLFYEYNEVELNSFDYDYNIDIDGKVTIFDKQNCKIYDYCFDDRFSYMDNIKKGVFLFFEGITKISPPWGTLTGIRPTKRVIELLKEGLNEDSIVNELMVRFCCSIGKAKLAIEVAKTEISIVNTEKNVIGLYLGMPFCPTRCLYCSFASNPIKTCEKLVKPYLEALSKEISMISKYINDKKLKIETVYFGGGTPTAVNNEEFEMILNDVYTNFIKDKNVKEFTVECGRPDSITEEKLMTMKRYDVSRISINPQSMNEKTLKTIGRHHTIEEVKKKFHLARKLGFTNINMDLIIGLPNEGVDEVKTTCAELFELKPDSVTVHGLAIKRGSRLQEDLINDKKYSVAKNSNIITMYNEVENLANKLNMRPYYMYKQKNMVGNLENVGYATDNNLCIYNIQMIEEKQTIIALGADGISKVVFHEENRHERFANLKDVLEYTKRIDELLDKKKAFLDTLYK